MSDVRVVERGERFGFLLEARYAHRVSGERRGQNLDRDVTAERRIARAIDLTHTADTNEEARPRRQTPVGEEACRPRAPADY